MSDPILQSDTRLEIQAQVLLLHLGLPLAFICPPTGKLLLLSCVVYLAQMFAMEGIYHRYFAHHAYKTSRPFQLILAVWAASTGQRGVITWASHHRCHHKHSDTALDPHSPVVLSFWQAHIAWVWDDERRLPDPNRVRDWLRYPELVWINRYHFVVFYGVVGALAVAGWAAGGVAEGAAWVSWGFVVPTLLSMHMTLMVNSLAHGARLGVAPFDSGDQSRNVWWLGLLTLGAGWHNNHHAYSSAARAGLWWWQLDGAYYVLRLWALLGLVWEVREFPERMRAR